MFASKVAKPQTRTAAGSADKVRRQHPNWVARPFGDAVEQAPNLEGMIGKRGGPRYLTRRLSGASAQPGGEHPEAATLTQETPATGRDLSTPPLARTAAPRDVRHVIDQPDTHVISFTFLVDDKGAVHVRPFDASAGFTSIELSTITGTTFPEPF